MKNRKYIGMTVTLFFRCCFYSVSSGFLNSWKLNHPVADQLIMPFFVLNPQKSGVREKEPKKLN